MQVASHIRRWLQPLRRTPLHPQWLLGRNADTTEWIGKEASGRVLDVGCAERWTHKVLPAACEYIALDYPPTGGALYLARPDVFCDACRLPFADATVDTVLLLEVLEHLRHPAQALSEISRVLRPGGKLLLTLPFLYPVHDAPHDYQRYTAFGLVRDIERAGLLPDVPAPTLGSAQSAGLLFNLAIAGMLNEAIAQRRVSMVVAPFLAVLIPVVNLGSWCLALLLPRWPALTSGYRVRAMRP